MSNGNKNILLSYKKNGKRLKQKDYLELTRISRDTRYKANRMR